MDSPRRLGRYEVLRHLASGGMAQVLLARATGIEGFARYVVIKQIHVERAREKAIVQMFLDEARLAASLHHANIVQVHDIGQEAGEYFFAMEYLHGEDLRVLLSKLSERDELLPLEHVVTIVSSVAAALHYAHELRGPDRKPLGLVHRDVSPANVIVGYDGNVKVVDFGIAKAAHRSRETRSGTLKGKISYMSPEQCMGVDVDRRSDVFALGIVLYELYTVRRLFKAPSDFMTMSAIVAGQVPSPRQHRPDIPPELEAIMMRALATRPEDRFQTAEEMRVALDRFAVAQGLRTSTTALADYMIAMFGRRPEPWLVEDDQAEISVSDPDFDGSGSGLARPPDALPDELLAQPGSPLAHARARSVNGPPRTLAKVRPATPLPDGIDIPTTSSGTPMAWAPSPVGLRPHRRWGIALGLFATLAIGAGVFYASRGGDAEPRAAGGGPRAAAPASPEAPAAAPAPAPAAEPAPAPAPAVEPAPAPPPAPAPVAAPPPPAPALEQHPTPPPPPAGKVAHKPKPAAPTKPAPAKPAEKKSDEQWDPDALFLKKSAP